jgi:hypothetical protein
MTDAQFLAWLQDPSAIRIVLVEAKVNSGGSEITRYLSTGNYNTSPTDAYANNLHYMPILSAGGVSFTESLSLDLTQASLQVGDIQIFNHSGVRDNWLNDIWVNRSVQAFVGDPRWIRSDFRMIFNGVVSDIAPNGRDMLGLKLRDKLQLLNTPVTDSLLGGTSSNKDQLLPLLFGEGHNINPLLTEPTQLEYQIHNGIVESINEVRDNGLPVTVTSTPSTGKFKLSATPAGTITVSAAGDKPAGTYYNTLSQLVQRLVTGFGTVANRFVAGTDLDTTNLTTFETAHPQAMGMWLNGRTNVLNAVQMLTGSLNAQIVMSRLGLLQLYQLTFGNAATSVIQPKHMVEKSLVAKSRTVVKSGVQLGFNKNWTVQMGLQTSLPAAHKTLFETDWLTSVKTSATVQTNYKLNALPVQQDTMLLKRTDADTEATRQLAMWSVPRTVYEFEGTPEMLLLTLGQTVTVYNSRYGMSAGVNGVVIALQPDWINSHCKVGFIV